MTDLFAILGGEEHCHKAAFQLGVLLHGCGFGAGIGEVHQQLFTNIGVRHLTAAEADADLDAVAVAQKLEGGLDLGVQVVGVDTGAHADLFDLHDPLILLGILFPLLLIVAEFGIVHDLADRGCGIGGDLHQIQALLICHGICLGSGNDTQLGAVFTDKPDLLIPDLLIELMF